LRRNGGVAGQVASPQIWLVEGRDIRLRRRQRARAARGRRAVPDQSA
jgi:hypothetical protein